MTRSRKALRTRTIGTGAMARTYLALKEVDAMESAARYLRDRPPVPEAIMPVPMLETLTSLVVQ